ncbi:2,5-diamino-6-(ribosylamino)-4(3H)-pyrimidinone 5'-phosphate reductase [Cryptococcus deuterogattii MMRL2647]|nr:2,5-diamino-6-(ribosylamino)-4(3H)-pyrimidinone 5'-phosphate reductase [Cryptococcus deuterogattii MMRL2647]
MASPSLLHEHVQSHAAPLARPHVTLTWAQSLDSKIAGVGGKRVILSGPESMLMTHQSVLPLPPATSRSLTPPPPRTQPQGHPRLHPHRRPHPRPRRSPPTNQPPPAHPRLAPAPATHPRPVPPLPAHLADPQRVEHETCLAWTDVEATVDPLWLKCLQRENQRGRTSRREGCARPARLQCHDRRWLTRAFQLSPYAKKGRRQ